MVDMNQKLVKLDNQTLQRIKDDALARYKEIALRHIEPELFVCYCYCKAIEAEARRQSVEFAFELPSRHLTR